MTDTFSTDARWGWYPHRAVVPPPPPPPLLQYPLFGPIRGVSDGSRAATGMVGEFVTGTSPVTYAGYPNVSTNPVVPLALPAGDWDVWAYCDVTSVIGGLSFWLQPSPAGLSNNMAASSPPALTTAPAGRVLWYRILGTQAYAHLAQTTGLAFQVQVDQSASSSLPDGTLTLTVEARRRR